MSPFIIIAIAIIYKLSMGSRHKTGESGKERNISSLRMKKGRGADIERGQG